MSDTIEINGHTYSCSKKVRQLEPDVLLRWTDGPYPQCFYYANTDDELLSWIEWNRYELEIVEDDWLALSELSNPLLTPGGVSKMVTHTWLKPAP